MRSTKIVLILTAICVAGLLGLGTPAQTGQDRVFKRDGTRVYGRLNSVDATHVVISGKIIERSQVRMILFPVATVPEAWPSSQQSGASKTDLVTMQDGRSFYGHVSRVTATSVVQNGVQLPRADVNVIEFDVSSPGDIGTVEPEGATPTPSPTPFPSPSPPTKTPTRDPNKPPSPKPPRPLKPKAPSPPSGGGRSGQKSPRGGVNPPDNCETADATVWTGLIYGERRDTFHQDGRPFAHEYTTSVRVRFREIKEHISKTDHTSKYGFRYVGCHVKLKLEASETKRGYNGPLCSNHITSTYRYNGKDVTAHELASGDLVYKTSNEPVSFTNQDTPREGIYELSINTGGAWSPCLTTFPEVGGTLGGELIDIGTLLYNNPRTEEEIARSTNYPPMDLKLRLLSEKRTRMTGSYNYRFDTDSESTITLKVRWDICRQGNNNCVGTPPEPPSGGPPPVDPCGSTAKPDSFVQTCQTRRDADAKRLEKDWNKFQQEWQETSSHLHDYQVTIAACAGWDIIGKVLGYLVGQYPGSGGVPKNASNDVKAYSEELKKFGEAMKFISKGVRKTLNGDNPGILLAPDGIQKLAEAGDTIKKFLSIANGITPEGMAEKLSACGAPIPDATFLSAKRYVELLQQSLTDMARVRTQVNNIRQLDLKCLDYQFDAYRACVEYARCKGTAESDCANKKPPGDWPEIP